MRKLFYVLVLSVLFVGWLGSGGMWKPDGGYLTPLVGNGIIIGEKDKFYIYRDGKADTLIKIKTRTGLMVVVDTTGLIKTTDGNYNTMIIGGKSGLGYGYFRIQNNYGHGIQWYDNWLSLMPLTDNGAKLGAGTRRWSGVYTMNDYIYSKIYYGGVLIDTVRFSNDTLVNSFINSGDIVNVQVYDSACVFTATVKEDTVILKGITGAGASSLIPVSVMIINPL